MISVLFLALLAPQAHAAKVKCPKGNKYFKEKHDNGALKAQGCHYFDGSNDGPYESFSADGQVLSSGTYDRGAQTGSWQYWHANGKVSQKCEYARNLKMGTCEEWFDNGNQKLTSEWNDGKKDGPWKQWAKDGTLLEEGAFISDMSKDDSDKPHGEWTYYYEDGSKQRFAAFHYGEADGEWVEWYADGTLQLVGKKQGDKWHGKYLEFHHTGHKRVEGEYSQGDMIGEVHYFAPSGRMTEKSNWRGGVRHGLAESFDRDNEVYAVQCFQYGERQWVADKADKWECPDPFGVLFRPAMQQGKRFSDGYAAVRIGGKWGYINEQGRVAITPQYEKARTFRGGMAGVSSDGKTFYAIDKTGTKLSGVTAPGEGSGSTHGIVMGETDGLVDYFKRGRSLWARAERQYGKNAPTLLPVVKDGKWGYINADGEVQIELAFQRAGTFSEGLAAVGERGYVGYINSKGEMVIPAQLDQGGAFSCGMAWVHGPGGPGYIDRYGLSVTGTAIDKASTCANGLARVKVDGSYGFLHNSGRMLVAPRFKKVTDFAGGFAGAPDDSSYIDRTGRSVYTNLMPLTEFRDGMAVANQRVGGITKYVVLQNDGKYEIIKHEISRTDSVEFSEFSEGLTAMTLGSGAGYVNAKGDVVIKPTFQRTRAFSGGLGATQTDKGWGFVKADGSVAIGHTFANVGDFHDGLAKALDGEKWGYINTSGEWIVKPEFDLAEDFSHGLGKVVMGEAVGYAKPDGSFAWEVSK
jgi:antitoxin component YwqK of YwqJK toxin-antitoxin module